MKFALQRKSGYRSPYSLGMVYPSYRKGVFFHAAKDGQAAPILVQLPFGRRRWYRVSPALVRFPSWIARKLNNRDAEGFAKA